MIGHPCRGGFAIIKLLLAVYRFLEVWEHIWSHVAQIPQAIYRLLGGWEQIFSHFLTPLLSKVQGLIARIFISGYENLDFVAGFGKC